MAQGLCPSSAVKERGHEQKMTAFFSLNLSERKAQAELLCCWNVEVLYQGKGEEVLTSLRHERQWGLGALELQRKHSVLLVSTARLFMGH